MSLKRSIPLLIGVGLVSLSSVAVAEEGTPRLLEPTPEAQQIRNETEQMAHDPVLESIQVEAWRDYRLSPIDRRLALEAASRDNPFAIAPHRPVYLLPLVYNDQPNTKPFEGRNENELNSENLDNMEAKFQISLKFLLWERIFDHDIDLHMAYTQQSWWQVYNDAASRPFRETDHEPEIFLTFKADQDMMGVRNRLIQFGVVHQSNGQSEPLSRSWNRLYLNFIMERGNFVMGIKPWYRLKEDPEDDDNPDIQAYLGYGDLNMLYYWHDQEFSVQVRNNLRTSDNRGSVELGWSFPLYKNLRGYVQYFNGYGQSLIDYNVATNQVGIGLMLINWL